MLRFSSQFNMELVNFIKSVFDSEKYFPVILSPDKRRKLLKLYLDYFNLFKDKKVYTYEINGRVVGFALIIESRKKISFIKKFLLYLKLLFLIGNKINYFERLESELPRRYSNFPLLFMIGVSKKYRRKGIGSKILNRVLKDYDKIILLTNKNLYAYKWYLKRGFKETSSIKTETGTFVWMVKE